MSKWYVSFSEAEKSKIESEIHRAILTRDRKWTNFLDYRNYKLIYRQYAGLFFIFCVDYNDNELSIYELIHMVVETLDLYFGNVCELDLIFHFGRVYHIVDEIIMAGEISETAKHIVLEKIRQIDKLE